MSLIFLVLFLAGISKGLCSQAVDHWGYPKEERDGVVRENENWGGECDTGRRQSPIDLDHDASVKGHFSELMFAGYEEPIENAAVTNTGHSIQINVGAPKHVILGGGGLPGSYHFDQMHFHWGSEHTINDKRYALELHMVHHESRFPTIADAAQIKRGIAVLGILFHISADPNPYLDNIIEAAENVGDVMGKSKVLEEQLSPINLLPKHRSQYFRYEGSLTTPGCGEAVIWTIFPDSLPISMDQYEKFKTMIKGEDGTLTNNFRSLQPLNSRPLVYVSSDVESYDGNSSSVISYSLFLIIILQMAVYVHLR